MAVVISAGLRRAGLELRVASPMRELPLSEGCYARVRLCPGCDGAGKPYHTAEDGMRVLITVTDHPGDHCVVGNYKGGPWSTAPKPPGGLGVGRYFRPDELEVLPPDRIDPSPTDDAERRAGGAGTMPIDEPGLAEAARGCSGAVHAG